jgi:hypothetical protein
MAESPLLCYSDVLLIKGYAGFHMQKGDDDSIYHTGRWKGLIIYDYIKCASPLV